MKKASFLPINSVGSWEGQGSVMCRDWDRDFCVCVSSPDIAYGVNEYSLSYMYTHPLLLYSVSPAANRET